MLERPAKLTSGCFKEDIVTTVGRCAPSIRFEYTLQPLTCILSVGHSSKTRPGVFMRPAPLGVLSPSRGFSSCLPELDFPICHTWFVPRLRGDVDGVVRVLASPISCWSNSLGTRRAEHISSRTDVLVTAFEHCANRTVTVFPTPLPPIKTQSGGLVDWIPE